MRAYRHKGTGVVIAVEEDSSLADVVTGSGQYDAASLDDLATDVPAFGGDGNGAISERDELDGNWLVPTGTRPEAITAASFGGRITPADTTAGADGTELEGDVDPAVITAAYEVDTVEGVNGYLDDHPEHAPAVLAHEAANKNRAGIVDGRHRAAAGE